MRPFNSILYEQLHFLPLADLFTLEQCKIIYKISNNLLRSNSNIVKINEVHNYSVKTNNFYLSNIGLSIALTEPLTKIYIIQELYEAESQRFDFH